MSRRRLERGFWNGRQVNITDKEYNRIYMRRTDRGGRYYHRHGMTMRMDWPFPTEFTLEYRLPRKTKKALWKQFNGHPEADSKGGVHECQHWTMDGEPRYAIIWSVPGLLHNGRKP